MDESLLDGQVLKENINGLHHKGKDYNIHIHVGKYKKDVDKCFKELLELKSHKDNEDIDVGLDKNGKLSAINAAWVRGSHPALHTEAMH